MALTFPANPVNGSTATTGGVNWTYDGYRWVMTQTASGYTGSQGSTGLTGYTGSAGINATYLLPVETQASNYVLTQADNGYILTSTGGNITINPGTISSGSNFIIYNNSGGAMLIIANTGVTMYKSGISTTAATSAQLVQFGYGTILCVNSSSSTFTISGPGIS